ncbi:uncharacterized protein RJT21DRAFT_79834 [Scheffersomyces amazonensis]|uniref:uncharacterized protein n=1 Tax=Scheffersomyces amazonensis TaxID=1078765 RepID=UPI00315CE567
MNSIRKVNEINQRELAQNLSYTQSWHYDYRDTNYIYIGNIPINSMKSIDIITIFSQYGIPSHIHFFDDKPTSGGNGFAFLKYENFKSCVLAIDNLNGIEVLEGKRLRVDHTYYKLRGSEHEDDYLIDYKNKQQSESKQLRSIEAKVDDELRDPMEDFNNINTNTTTSSTIEDPEDEFKDPMEQFLKNKSTTNKVSKSHHHRHKHNHRKHSESRK